MEVNPCYLGNLARPVTQDARNAWNLYQGCTEIMKTQSPARQIDGLKALNQVLAAALN